MAQVAPSNPLAGSLTAARRTGEILLLAVLPITLALFIIIGAISNRYAFDFHGSLWQAARMCSTAATRIRRRRPPASHLAIASSIRRRSPFC